MAYTILIVDDEPALQRLLGEILTQAGYRIETAGSCQEARSRFQQAAPDAVLLDVMLPDGDGFSLLGDLRRERDLPVLFLSARDEDEARLRGLGLGADDYITKPFLPQELLLRTLWENRGRIVTIDSLCAALWDGPLIGYDNALMVHIRRLREKLADDPSHPRYLLTVRGLGYRLAREEEP